MHPIGTIQAFSAEVEVPRDWVRLGPGVSLPAASHPVLDGMLPYRRPPRRWWQWPKAKRRPYGGDADTIVLPDFSAHPPVPAVLPVMPGMASPLAASAEVCVPPPFRIVMLMKVDESS